jgi:hypothetical protein
MTYMFVCGDCVRIQIGIQWVLGLIPTCAADVESVNVCQCTNYRLKTRLEPSEVCVS